MLFVIDCRDKPGSQDLRTRTRQAHLDYLTTFKECVVAAGPTLTDDGQAMTGSVLIVDCDDRSEAEAFAKNDPYAQAGLFEQVIIRAWRKVLPKD
jgi:hypothetical protein